MFKKASKSQSKLRLAIFGPSGSGKTYTALRLATGIGGKIAVIDTERGSAAKYADVQRTGFVFDVAELEAKTIDEYCRFIEGASGVYNVLIIDSMSHAWQELLQEVEMLSQAKYRGNTWSAWSEGTPKQKKLVNTILNFKGHLIATMRSKTEWTTSQENGKTRPTRVGLAPEQGKGIEYEFDMLMEITPEHFATVIKDRTGKYQDRIIDKPGEDLGRELAAWLSDGASISETEVKLEFDPPKPKKKSPLNSAALGTPGMTAEPQRITEVNEPAREPINELPAPDIGEYVFRTGPYKGKFVFEVEDKGYLLSVMTSPECPEFLKQRCLIQMTNLIEAMNDFMQVSVIMTADATPVEIKKICYDQIEKLTIQGAV